MTAIDDVRNTMIKILNSANTLRINFIYRGIPINGTGFQRVDSLLKQGAFTIEIDARITQIGAAAAYHPPTDTFIFAAANVGGNVDDEAKIVHECVHALYDYQKHPYLIDKAEAEAPAYLAGSMYLLYANSTPRYGSDPVGQAKQAALDLAKKIYLSFGAAVSEHDATHLERLLRAIPSYSSFYSHFPYYDGIDPVRARQRRQTGRP